MFFIAFLLLIASLVTGVVLLAIRKRKAGGIALGIFVGLVALLFADAQLDKRSTAGHMLRHFKGEDGSHQDMHDLAEDTQKTVDSAELQQWAVTILQQAQPTNTPPTIPADKVPASIRNLTSGEFHLHLNYAQCDPSLDSVWIEWGGPFGHWGIRVGSPTFTFKPDSEKFYDFIMWKSGIYFWCETR